MFVVIVEFTLHANAVEAFRKRVLQQARDSLAAESECHVFDVCLDPQNPAKILLYEVYSDRNAFDLHLASQHFIDFDLCVRDWIMDKRVTTYTRL